MWAVCNEEIVASLWVVIGCAYVCFVTMDSESIRSFWIIFLIKTTSIVRESMIYCPRNVTTTSTWTTVRVTITTLFWISHDDWWTNVEHFYGRIIWIVFNWTERYTFIMIFIKWLVSYSTIQYNTKFVKRHVAVASLSVSFYKNSNKIWQQNSLILSHTKKWNRNLFCDLKLGNYLINDD